MALVALSDASMERVLRDPPLIWQVVAPDDPERYEEARARKRPGLLARLFRRRADSPPPTDLELAPAEGSTTDLDKAWHGIHYLLTGTAWEGKAPLNFLVAGGRAVGDIDVGYGPARVLTAAETRRARDALGALSDDALTARFAPADMVAKEIYPPIWTRPPEEDDTLDYLVEYVTALRTFLDEAVAKGLGLVVYLS